MQHVIASRDRFAPAVVAQQVGGGEADLVGRKRAPLAQHRDHVLAPIRIAQRGSHRMPVGKQLQDGMHADETGSARDQNRAHVPSLFMVRQVCTQCIAHPAQAASGHYLTSDK